MWKENGSIHNPSTTLTLAMAESIADSSRLMSQCYSAPPVNRRAWWKGRNADKRIGLTQRRIGRLFTTWTEPLVMTGRTRHWCGMSYARSLVIFKPRR